MDNPPATGATILDTQAAVPPSLGRTLRWYACWGTVVFFLRIPGANVDGWAAVYAEEWPQRMLRALPASVALLNVNGLAFRRWHGGFVSHVSQSMV